MLSYEIDFVIGSDYLAIEHCEYECTGPVPVHFACTAVLGTFHRNDKVGIHVPRPRLQHHAGLGNMLAFRLHHFKEYAHELRLGRRELSMSPLCPSAAMPL